MEISKQKNIKEYLERYENTAKNMKQIFYEKNPRNHNLKSIEVNIYQNGAKISSEYFYYQQIN